MEETKANELDRKSSRKYRFVFFWNVMTGVSILLQAGLAVAKIDAKIPLELMIGFSGGLTAGYLGINVWEKKVPGMPAPSSPVTKQ